MPRKRKSTFYKKVNNATDQCLSLIQNSIAIANSENDNSADVPNQSISFECEHSEAQPDLQSYSGLNYCEPSFNLNECLEHVDLPQFFEKETGNNGYYSTFKNDLITWALKNQTSHCALSELLKLLKTLPLPDLSKLPSDARTFLSTPRSTDVRKVDPGFYSHIGIRQAVKKLCRDVTVENSIELLCNIDGLPLSKSSGSQIYPILCSLYDHYENVALIGVYHGYAKPACANDFLEDFVTEAVELARNGISINDKLLRFSIKGFICDAPAKAFIRYNKGHTGFYSCTKCMQKGFTLKGRTCFPKINCKNRTDADFTRKSQMSHHTGTSLLEKIPGLGMVTSFPLEYMHLLCLGVMKKLLVNLWLFKKIPNRLSLRTVRDVSNLHMSFKNHVPVEFARRPRSLDDIKRWKATEFRFFLFYSGPVVLKNFLSAEKYLNFLCLHVACTIFSNSQHAEMYHNFAKSLLQYFVQKFGELYGKEHISHNVHGLLHVPDDVRNFGCFDSYSAFSFENHLQKLKALVRKSQNPLSQIVRRTSELESLNISAKEFSQLPSAERMHYNGPVPKEFENCDQYSRVRLNSFILDTNMNRNSFCALQDKTIIKVSNIIVKNNELYIVGNMFTSVIDFFVQPCKSSALGIYFVKDLSTLRICTLKEIACKLVAFDYDSGYVVFPLLHTK